MRFAPRTRYAVLALALLAPLAACSADQHSAPADSPATSKSDVSTGQQQPNVLTLDHHDTSPALRDLVAQETDGTDDRGEEEGEGPVGNQPWKEGDPPVVVRKKMIPRAPHDAPDPVAQTRLIGPRRTVKPNGSIVTTSASTSRSAPSIGTGFDGPGNGMTNFTVRYAPPDTNSAVGLTQIVTTVNVGFAVQDKSGNLLLGPLATNTVFSGFGGACATNNDGDAVVRYDRLADRWVLTQFSVSSTPYYECVAVSKT